MPRQSRIDAPGALHHIISRGIEKHSIYEDAADRENFLDRLGNILTETQTPCYAWALIPNHFHLLLKTGEVPVTTVMRRLLTGHAIHFNRRHKRHGHLFQNRYKSILCQQDAYLLVLVRYIHLNPIRAGLASNLAELDAFPYSGHSCLMGYETNPWQDVKTVFNYFGNKKSKARSQYQEYIHKGISDDNAQAFSGGGLIRSVGGWQVLKSLRRSGIHVHSDERILGDNDFVQAVLKDSAEQMDRKHALVPKDMDFEAVGARVSQIFNLPIDRILNATRQPDRVTARSVLAYWAVRKIGMTTTGVGKKLGLSQSATSRAVQRGERIVDQKKLCLVNEPEKTG